MKVKTMPLQYQLVLKGDPNPNVRIMYVFRFLGVGFNETRSEGEYTIYDLNKGPASQDSIKRLKNSLEIGPVLDRNNREEIEIWYRKQETMFGEKVSENLYRLQ